MATVILSTVGRAVGGPAGAILGTFAGSTIDRSLLGGGSAGGRLSDLSIQSSAYGEAIPRLYGTIRVAGALIWSTGLIERRGSGSGKGSAGNGYAYSISAAFAVSARPVVAFGRIWADGKLIRDTDGLFNVATGFRQYNGGERQRADPLIASAEGVSGVSAYRGLAYAVFEDLQLADFGNRVPQLTFEVICDAAPPSVGQVIDDLTSVGSISARPVEGSTFRCLGYGIGRVMSLRQSIEQLGIIEPSHLTIAAGRLALRATDAPPTMVSTEEIGAVAAARPTKTERRSRQSLENAVREVAIGYFDVARDYQPGLQRARRLSSGPGAQVTHELPLAASADTAKLLAETIVARMRGGRSTLQVSLPYKYVTIEPGDLLVLGGARWRVVGCLLENMCVVLDLEADGIFEAGSTVSSDGGRAAINPINRQGPSLVRALDLPTLPGESSLSPRLLLAVSSNGPGWRSADVQMSADNGASFASVGITRQQTVMGFLTKPLMAGTLDRWDQISVCEVELLNDQMWLESVSIETVLQGANLALVGDELIQFQTAEAIGERRFILRGLLRGRFGSDWATALHSPGTAFTMVETATLLSANYDRDAIGGAFRARAIGPIDVISSVPTIEIIPRAENLIPPAPVHIRVVLETSGAVEIGWVRRSRTGYNWNDGVDAPIGEEREAYLVGMTTALGRSAALTSELPRISLTPADQINLVGEPLRTGTVTIRQLGGVGYGHTATAAFTL